MESNKFFESENDEYFSDNLVVYEVEIEEEAGVLTRYVTDKSMDNFNMEEESSVPLSSTNTNEDADPENTQSSLKSDIDNFDENNDSNVMNIVFPANKDDENKNSKRQNLPSLYTDDMNASITTPKESDFANQSLGELGIELNLPLIKTSPSKLSMVPSSLNKSKLLQNISSSEFNSPSKECDDNTTDTSCSSPSIAKDSVPLKVSVLGKEQAKRRLQAFSLNKQSLLKSPLAKKIPKKTDTSGNESKDEVRFKRKKALLPNEKAKAVIEEIEEIKKVEIAYFEALKEGIFNNPHLSEREREYRQRSSKRNDKSRSRSRHRSRSKDKSFSREKGRKYKRRSSPRRRKEERKSEYRQRSKSPPIKEPPPKKVVYPSDWTEMKQNGYSFEDILKVKPGDPPIVDYRKLIASLVTFEMKYSDKHDLIVKGVMGNDKTCPPEYLNFTITQPSLSYCENTAHAPNLYYNRQRLMSEISKDRAEYMNKIINSKRSKYPNKCFEYKPKWYPKENYLNTMESSTECHILENDLGIGLSILQCYAEDEEEDEDFKSKETIYNDNYSDVDKKSKLSNEKKSKKKDKKKHTEQRKTKTTRKDKNKIFNKDERIQNEENVSDDEMMLFDQLESKLLERKRSFDKSRSASSENSFTMDSKELRESIKHNLKKEKFRRKKEKEMQTIKEVVEIAKGILEKYDNTENSEYKDKHLSSPIYKKRTYEKDRKKSKKEKHNKEMKSVEREIIKPGKEIIPIKDFESEISLKKKPKNEVIPLQELESRIVQSENKSPNKDVPDNELEKKPEKLDKTNKTKDKNLENRTPENEIVPLNEFETKALLEDMNKEEKDGEDTPKTEEYYSNWEDLDEATLCETQGSERSNRNKFTGNSAWESDDDNIHKSDKRQQMKLNDERRKRDEHSRRDSSRSQEIDLSLYCNPHRDNKHNSEKRTSLERKTNRRSSNDRKSESIERKHFTKESDKKSGVRLQNKEKDKKDQMRRKSNERKSEKEASYDKRKDDRFNWEDEETITERHSSNKYWDKNDKSDPKKRPDLVKKIEQYYNDWEDEDQFEIDSKKLLNNKLKTEFSLSPSIKPKHKSYYESDSKFIEEEKDLKPADKIKEETNIVVNELDKKYEIKQNKNTINAQKENIEAKLKQIDNEEIGATPPMETKDSECSKLASEYEEFMKAVGGDMESEEKQPMLETAELQVETKLEKKKDVKDKEEPKKKRKRKESSSSSSSSYSSDSDSDSSSDESSESSSTESDESGKEKNTLQKPLSNKGWVDEFNLESEELKIVDMEEPTLTIKEDMLQSPESSTPNSMTNTPSPKKSRPLIPIKFLTAESRKQANIPSVKQLNVGFGVVDTLNVFTSADSPKVSSSNLNDIAAKTDEETNNRKRSFPWVPGSGSSAKKLLLEEANEEDQEEDFTDKFIKKLEDVNVDNANREQTDPELKDEVNKNDEQLHEKGIKPSIKDKPRDDSDERKHSKENRGREKSRRSLSDDRRGRRSRSLEKRRDRYSRDKGSSRRRSRSRSFDRDGHHRSGRRTTRRERSRERDRRRGRDSLRDGDRMRSRSRSLERHNDRRIRRSSRSPDRERRICSPNMMRNHDYSDYNNPYSDIVKSPVNSPLDGFKRSLADSTISDSDLLMQKHNSEDYNERSPRYSSNNAHYYPQVSYPRLQASTSGASQSVDSPSSPKRISLDDRINEVLGIDKEPNKPIDSIYGHHQTAGNQQQHYNAYPPHYYDQYSGQYISNQNQYDQYGNMKPPHYPSSYPPPYPPVPIQQNLNYSTPQKIVQVGNLQVVPTEGIMPSVPPPPPSSAGSVPKAGSSEIATQKVVRVGNMLQIVPQPLPVSGEGAIGTVSSAIPAPIDAVTVQPQQQVAVVDKPLDSPVIAQHKNSEQLVAERKVEREKRHLEREKRRKEKEKKRKEKEKRKQLKLKLKTENMIKRALLLETEGAMALGDTAEAEPLEAEEESPLIASWPPTPLVLPSTILKPAGKGILVNHEFNSDESFLKTQGKKSVKFADGVCPGEGTSPSAGEDLPSPPPPIAKKLVKEKKFKKTKQKIPKMKKKKIKVKIIRTTQPQFEEDSEEDNLPPPSPPPGSPPPHIFPPRVKTHTINNIHPAINHLPPEMAPQIQPYPYHPHPPTSGYPPPNMPPMMMYPPGPPHPHPGHPHPNPVMMHGPPGPVLHPSSVVGPPGSSPVPNYPPMGSSPAPSSFPPSHPPVYPPQMHPPNQSPLQSQPPPTHGLHQTQHPPALPPQGAHRNF